jgi:hypothetical protein
MIGLWLQPVWTFSDGAVPNHCIARPILREQSPLARKRARRLSALSENGSPARESGGQNPGTDGTFTFFPRPK